MPMMMIESFDEFAARNGGSPLEVGGRLLFPTGAQSDLRNYMRQEPPADPYRRLRLQHAYYQERLRRAEDHFEAERHAASQQASYAARNSDLPGITEHTIERLKELKAHAKRCRKDFEKIDAELAATPQERQYRARERQEAERRQTQENLMEQVARLML